MASSRNSLSIDALTQAVSDGLRSFVCPGDRLCVAYSGGLDSTVLLHLLARLRGGGVFGDVQALHVNHGLNPAADAWAAHCQAQCAALNLPCHVVRVEIDIHAPEGVEAAARGARYRALERVDADYVVLAHHRDDQAETLLLNLLRGAGVHGAAAMPHRQGRYLRPLLALSRAELQAYGEAAALQWIEDGSNADVRYTRNFLRQAVMPVLTQRFPAAAERLAAAAANFADARELLDDLARSDGAEAVPLPMAALRGLSAARAVNVLTFHLRAHGLRVPGRRRIGEWLRQLLESQPERPVDTCIDGRQICRFRDALWVLPAEAPLHELPQSLCLELPDPGSTRTLSWGGGLITLRAVVGEGVARRHLGASVRLRPRGGGELLRPYSGRPRRPLKDWLREAALPPWLRHGLPVLEAEGRVLWVGGVGTDVDYRPEPQEDGISFEFAPPTW